MICRPVGDRHFEMGGTGDAVELMQVVGHHAQIDEPLAKRGLRFDRIVDSRQEHGLVQQHDACIGESANRRRNMRIEFIRMVGVEHRRSALVESREACRSIRRSRVRESRSATAYESAAAAREESGERVDQFRQCGVDKRQRIAAAENHFVHDSRRAAISSSAGCQSAIERGVSS